MAHHKSAIKRIRQTRTRNLYNRLKKKTMREAIKAVRACTSYEEAQEKLRLAGQILDRTAAKGVIHKNNAANKKSKLSAFVKGLKDQQN